MTKIPETMCRFINGHHVLCLATSYKESLSCCSLFYLFIPEEACVLFASDEKTEHMQHISHHPQVACAIHNETKEVAQIRGIQIKGAVSAASEEEEHSYIEAYPYAKKLKNKGIWKLEISELKYTDNTQGFGKKERWERS
ncbi:MAG: pyridoxamine 5'-phosphate oxidase family protein [Campylobacterales bacterium]|nr:pyridoxamine 5'-phosphate oxidase family protein [Campylobacterales bacterium]